MAETSSLPRFSARVRSLQSARRVFLDWFDLLRTNLHNMDHERGRKAAFLGAAVLRERSFKGDHGHQCRRLPGGAERTVPARASGGRRRCRGGRGRYQPPSCKDSISKKRCSVECTVSDAFKNMTYMYCTSCASTASFIIGPFERRASFLPPILRVVTLFRRLRKTELNVLTLRKKHFGAIYYFCRDIRYVLRI